MHPSILLIGLQLGAEQLEGRVLCDAQYVKRKEALAFWELDLGWDGDLNCVVAVGAKEVGALADEGFSHLSAGEAAEF